MARRRKIHGHKRIKRTPYRQAVEFNVGALDLIQPSLQIAGNFGGVGAIADIANVGISAVRATNQGVRGNWSGVKKHTKEMLWNVVGAIPFTQAITGYRTIKNIVAVTEKANNVRENTVAALNLRNAVTSR